MSRVAARGMTAAEVTASRATSQETTPGGAARGGLAPGGAPSRAAPSRVAVGRATAGDAGALAALARALLPGAGRPASDAWVAREPGGRIAGYLDARRVADELHVLALAVAPEARRRGLASALLAEAVEEAVAQGARLCHLEVRDRNAAALRFYARHGFARVGRRGRYYPEGEDAVLLTRVLAPRPAARG